jgi:Rrf2 family protein
VRVLDAAAALDIPRNYLSKILHALARAGVLTSSRGRTGGFRLAHAADRITLWSVIKEFDRLPDQRRCLLGRPVCSDRTACAAHDAWKKTADSVAAFFRGTTVADLLKDVGADSRL